MTRIRMIGLAIASVLVVTAGATASALAAGPQWILSSALVGASLVPISSTNSPASMTLTEATQKFENGVESVECSGVTSTGSIWNQSNIGKDTAKITFTGCKVFKGKSATQLTECTVENAPSGTPGTITVSANTELVYLENNEAGPIGDLFSPASGTTTFVELNFVNTGSGELKCKSSGATKVVGSVVARVLVGLGLEASGTAMQAAEGFLMFPTSPITSSFRYSSGGLTKVTDGLKVFGTETATQSGESAITIPGFSGNWGVE